MSKPPQNPPGGGERTVIVRPNPAGRRDNVNPPPQPQPPAEDVWGAGPAQPPVAPGPGRVAAYQPPAAYPPGQSYQPRQPLPPSAYQQPGAVPPMQGFPAQYPQPLGGYQPPPVMPRPGDSGPPVDLGLAGHPEVPDHNPILAAARPLLLMLANVRLTADHAKVAPFMEAVAMEIATIERKLGGIGVQPEHIRLGKYAMCATADDIVQNLPGTDRSLWTQFSMSARFFGNLSSGVGFFEELARVKTHPTINADILELMHACLSLGFQGQYRSTGGGDVALMQIRRDLYQTLRTFRPQPPEDISPHWLGQNLKPEFMKTHLPVWLAATAALALLVAAFIALRMLLGFSSDALAGRLAALHSLDEVHIERADYKPLPPVEAPVSTQLGRIKGKLAADLSAARLTVGEAAGKVVVKLKTDVMFERGSADVKPEYAAVIEHVAAALDPEPKEISVVGHTDNTPIKARFRFKDNQQLSEERAKAVAAMMAPKLKEAGRLKTDGRGPDEPLVPNSSEANRAKNRRVEIFLPRTGP